jgi:hypothetical protein
MRTPLAILGSIDPAKSRTDTRSPFATLRWDRQTKTNRRWIRRRFAVARQAADRRRLGVPAPGRAIERDIVNGSDNAKRVNNPQITQITQISVCGWAGPVK